jgi:hypothetical protein
MESTRPALQRHPTATRSSRTHWYGGPHPRVRVIIPEDEGVLPRPRRLEPGSSSLWTRGKAPRPWTLPTGCASLRLATTPVKATDAPLELTEPDVELTSTGRRGHQRRRRAPSSRWSPPRVRRQASPRVEQRSATALLTGPELRLNVPGRPMKLDVAEREDALRGRQVSRSRCRGLETGRQAPRSSTSNASDARPSATGASLMVTKVHHDHALRVVEGARRVTRGIRRVARRLGPDV